MKRFQMTGLIAKEATPAYSRPPVEAAGVLATATARAAALLGLSGAALARVIGLSEPTVSRLLHGRRPLDPATKEGELALLLVRIYRSLDALVGNDSARRLAWMNTHNTDLGGIPRELVLTVQGLVMTLAYLDAQRAPA